MRCATSASIDDAAAAAVAPADSDTTVDASELSWNGLAEARRARGSRTVTGGTSLGSMRIERLRFTGSTDPGFDQATAWDRSACRPVGPRNVDADRYYGRWSRPSRPPGRR